MIGRLIRVELTRLRWRRAVVALLVVAIALPAALLATRAWNTRPVSDAERASTASTHRMEIEDCTKHPNRYGTASGAAKGSDAAARVCEKQIVGWYTRHDTLSFSGEREGTALAVVFLLAALMLLGGTTFVGHDWNTGSMSNQLLFESRRGQVWTAKAVAVGLAALVVSTAVISLYWLGVWAVIEHRGQEIADHAVRDAFASGLRGAGFAAAAALGGYALTMLFRSTVATIGILFAVVAAGGLVLATIGIGPVWEPTTNLMAIIDGEVTYYVNVPPTCGGNMLAQGGACDPERTLSLQHGVGYYGVALALVAGASVVSFRRRDVP